jgi:RNA polymerase sigma-70 factor (ECF subfamily)
VRVAWAVVYREVYADLVRFLHRKVWDADQAQDLAQETFVRALDHDPENPRAFVFTIAANLARDEARAAIRRKKHLTLMAGGAAEPIDGAAAAEEAADRERADAVRSALDQLNERDREVLLLWDAGFDYMEIARQTGLKPGAIGTTLARARKRLVEAHEATSQVARTQQTKQG